MASVTRSKRERNLQRRCVKYARSRGWRAFKMSPTGQRGWLDYLFNKRRQYLWVEFKAEGEEPTELQYARLKELVDDDERATWTDSFEVFTWHLDAIDDEITRTLPPV